MGLAVGQNANIDSLVLVLSEAKEDTLKVQTLCALSYALFGKNPDSTVLLAKQAYDLSVELNYLPGRSKSLNRVGIGFYMKGEYDSAYSYYLQSKEYALQLNDQETVANLNTNLGIIHYFKGEFDEAAALMEKSQDYYDAVGSHENQAKILANIGSIYLGVPDYEKAIQYFKRALEVQLHTNNARAIAVSYSNLGIAYRNLGQVDNALSYFYKAEQTVDGTGEQIIGSIYSSIANVHMDRNQYNKALEYRLKAKKYHEDIGDKRQLANTLSNVGMVYFNLDKLDSAHHYYRRAMQLMNEYTDVCGWMVYTNMSQLMLKQQSYDSAIFYAKTGIDKGQKCNNPILIAQCKGNMGEAYYQKGEYRRSFQLAREAHEIASDLKVKDIIMRASLLMSKNQEKLGDYESALNYYKESEALKDSIFDVEKAGELARMEAEHVFNKEKQLLELEAQKLALQNQAERDRNRLILYFSIAAIVLLAGLFIVAFVSYRRKNRDHQLISRQNQALEELSNFKEGLTHMIAHDMKNSLNTILGLSESEPYDKKMHTISQSGNVMLHLVTNMLDVQKFEEAKMQINMQSHALGDLIEAARQQTALFFQMKSLNAEIDIHRNLQLTVDKALMVRVLVNLITNAIKHSDSGQTIAIRSEIINRKNYPVCNILVKDQGEGIDQKELPYVFDKFWQSEKSHLSKSPSTGLGLTFCKMAVEAHQGTIAVSSIKGKGSEFCISLTLERDPEAIVNSEKVFYDSNVLKAISEADKALIKPYLPELRQLQIYQVGEINKILNQFTPDLETSQWRDDLDLAIKQANEERYKELLNLID